MVLVGTTNYGTQMVYPESIQSLGDTTLVYAFIYIYMFDMVQMEDDGLWLM